uniref:Contactin associated protein 2 n=1 Tax=Oryzias sinensis TaxID=183150 RepID=A0A8C7ZEV1_9TELE
MFLFFLLFSPHLLYILVCLLASYLYLSLIYLRLHIHSLPTVKCDETLAFPLPHTAFTSSSVFSNGYAPGYAKLNRRGGAGGWSPLDSDHYQWLQVDLGSRKQVSAIATQGRYSSSDWTTRYRLLYSDTGRNWKPYHQDGNIWAFSGNSNSESVVRHELQQGIVARFLRLIPLAWSEEGRIGLRIEIYGCSYCECFAFDKHALTVQVKKMKIIKDVIALRFKTSESEGVILHGEGQQGDYITLELRKAKLLLQINLGSNQYGSILGHTSVTTGSLLDDNHWHSVVIERYRRNVNFTLDRHTQHFRTNGEFDYLDLDYELTFGGMPYSGKPVGGGRKNFKGCMESINYNGDNITDLARRKKLDTSSFRNLSFSCVETHTFPVFFNASSFLQLPGRASHNMVSVGFQFRTWNPDGLLLFSNLDEGTLEISLLDGKIVVYINTSNAARNYQVDLSSGSGLNDGQWHAVRLVAKENFAMLTVDGEETSAVRSTSPLSINTGRTYHLGGKAHFIIVNTLFPPSQHTFQGCMQAILVDDQPADLHAVEKGTVGAFENVSLDMCAIIDRCMPNHCEHGGRCKQTWESFSCTCDGTGYSGATCHTSVYEPSCEAYKHIGKSSDSYWIDPDGSGPLGPFKVNCNMTEDNVWTTVVNNLAPKTAITGSSRERRTVLQVNYSASMEQVTAITTSAEYCEQQIAYSCRMSRLLNTPDGTPFTWWVGRGSEKHLYWGGSGPGIKKCACGIDRNCTDPKYDCNCDADSRQWREDSGLLVYKEHLPVSQVAVGDTNRPGSEAKLTVGPLRCHGDSKTYFIFLEEASQVSEMMCFCLCFPSAPETVSFSFDVGNGPVDLTVHSAAPLNDDQWHQVMAERNVKEAVLLLDQTYRTSRPAPAQGHTRLELFSQLYVGAAGGQRGFLGCIRALRMNGITLDLEERAKVTPGVEPGCQGHCTSFGMYCRNGGKCMERYNGYLCDCTATAYDGPFCTRDVGGFFEAGTLVKYNFLPEVVAGASKDSKALTKQLTPHEVNLTKEELAFSFSTSSAPAVLVYISSKTQDYMAVVLKQNGSLQVRYSLGGLKEPFSIEVDQRNLANGQPHSLNMSRHNRSISIQLDHYPPVSYTLPDASDTQFNLVKTLFLGKVFETGFVDPVIIERYNTPGFIGCLSRVQFNRAAPLKSALRAATQAAATGKLVESNCGASPLTIPPMSAATDPWHLDNTDALFPFNEERVIPDGVNRDSAIIGGIIAVVIFTILCTLVFLIRYMFRHKGTYHTNEAKGSGESAAESADTAIIGTDNPETIDESKKEWFI